MYFIIYVSNVMLKQAFDVDIFVVDIKADVHKNTH